MDRISLSRTILVRAVLVATIIIAMLPIIPGRVTDAAERVTTFDTFDTDEPYVALTFDVTFDRGDGELILNTLAAYDVRATFAVTGIWAQQNPDLMQRIVNEGHTLMNHTWDHFSMTGQYTGSVIHEQAPPLTAEEVASQLQRTEELVRQQVGVDMKPYVRPPYGDYTDETLAAMANAGYTYNVMWTVDTLGWHIRPVQEVIQRVMDAAQPGANILMHVGHGSTDGLALAGIIEGLRARGYGFATVQEFVEGHLARPDAPHLAADEQESRERIAQFWRENGGLLTFGYPVSTVYQEEDGTFVQYFQRARLEQHRGATPGRYEVHQTALDAATIRERTHDASFKQVGRRDTGRCTTFTQVDFSVCGRLRYHWEDTGGPALSSSELTAEADR